MASGLEFTEYLEAVVDSSGKPVGGSFRKGPLSPVPSVRGLKGMRTADCRPLVQEEFSGCQGYVHVN